MTDIEYTLNGLKLVASLVVLAWSVRVYHRAALAAFRQDLFAIRNRLWSEMRAAGRLDDPDHREARDRINTMIRFAPGFNIIFAVLAFQLVGRLRRSGVIGESAPSECEIIRRAEFEAFLVLRNRLIFNTLPGALIGWPLWLSDRVRRRLAKTLTAASSTTVRVRNVYSKLVDDAEEGVMIAERTSRAKQHRLVRAA